MSQHSLRHALRPTPLLSPGYPLTLCLYLYLLFFFSSWSTRVLQVIASVIVFLLFQTIDQFTLKLFACCCSPPPPPPPPFKGRGRVVAFNNLYIISSRFPSSHSTSLVYSSCYFHFHPLPVLHFGQFFLASSSWCLTTFRSRSLFSLVSSSSSSWGPHLSPAVRSRGSGTLETLRW